MGGRTPKLKAEIEASVVLNRKAEGDVAHLIEITALCQSLNCLPQPGGLLDQDGFLVSGILLVLEAQAAASERKNKTKG